MSPLLCISHFTRDDSVTHLSEPVQHEVLTFLIEQSFSVCYNILSDWSIHNDALYASTDVSNLLTMTYSNAAALSTSFEWIFHH